MSLRQRIYWITDTARELRWLHRELAIRPHELVLDVGSGARPHFRSNVLCDKFPHDAVERHGAAIRVDRPLVIGDIQRLPFATASFDVVICSHVLEHVEDPAAAVAELTRVGRRGYIETPSAEWERVAGFPFHRWMVSANDGALIFERKRAPVEDPELRRWFASLQARLGLGRYIWWRRRDAGVYTSLTWRGDVRVDVRDQVIVDDRFVHASVQEPIEPPSEAVSGRFDRLMEGYGQFVRRRSQPSMAELERLLRCPRCGGHLSREPDRMRCQDCQSAYRSDAVGTPWLLVESP
jgi:SAM-dependent methyltransferase